MLQQEKRNDLTEAIYVILKNTLIKVYVPFI